MTELVLSIFDPNTLLPHRAGIAGLALALSAIAPTDAPMQWEVTEDAVKLSWEGSDQEAIQWLLEQTYQIKRGLLIAPALNLDEQGCFTFNQGMLSSFLQHGQQKSFVEDPSKPKQGKKKFYKTQTLNFMIESDKPEISVSYTLLNSCYYTEAAKRAKDFSSGKPEVKTQILPGLEECFVNGSYKESSSNFLALLFLPLACGYYQLPIFNGKSRSAIVIPEVQNLKVWAKLRQKLPSKIYANFGSAYGKFRASSAGEAALRFLLDERQLDDSYLFKVNYCEVYQLGSQPWNGNQSFIKQAVYRVPLKDDALSLYRIAYQNLKPRLRSKQDGEGVWLAESKVLAWISDNLILDKTWYNGFFEFRKSNTIYPEDRRGLIIMSEYLNVDEQILFDAVQGAFRKYRGQQIDQAKRQGRQPDWEQITNKVIYRLQRPSTQQEFATALVDFLSQFRSKAALSSGSQVFWWLHQESNWRKARDLALLAIATYQGQSQEEKSQIEQEIEQTSTDETANVQ
ncbi:type I-MYXAN CRISPR-associated Cas8a1/Cmx1 [Egbenema bharatensis]|uniref:type I-MYXAN CRISPR-associated Cas8a1/Cmx1 n=1 Tax=Egbenema bharatensis TaxID=3463334 RepID=UPI003A86303E